MKKFFLIIGLLAGISLAVVAQPRAIGARLGYNLEVSYQHSLGENFLEIDAGAFGFSGVHAAVIYDWIFASPSWTPKGEWDWYAGVGGAGGFGFKNYYHENGGGFGYVGVAGQIGLSYTFWFPLQLSIDYRPTIGVWLGGKDMGFHSHGLFDGALSVRYSF